jgi:hypothetical protein
VIRPITAKQRQKPAVVTQMHHYRCRLLWNLKRPAKRDLLINAED